MSNTVLIDEFTKCRLTSIFGEPYGCLTLGTVWVVLGVVAIILLLILLIPKFTQREEDLE